MKKFRFVAAIAIVAIGMLGVTAVAVAGGGKGKTATLTGFEEVPALSTPGVGTFRSTIGPGQEIHYTLTFSGLESAATQAHIHFENATNAGPIVVFLCSNLGNGPVGTQAGPAAGGIIQGTLRPADIGAGAAGQGLAAGEFAEFVRALRAGATYVNVHSVGRPTGEIRAQLGDVHRHDHDD